MYQFDFVNKENDEQFISVLATDYKVALSKVRDIKHPDFDLTTWYLEGITEIQAIPFFGGN